MAKVSKRGAVKIQADAATHGYTESNTPDQGIAVSDAQAGEESIIRYDASDPHRRVLVYRHLLSNVRRKKGDETLSPRSAAVLARLQVTADLKQKPAIQKRLASDLDMGTSDLSGYLIDLLTDGLVTLDGGGNRRDKIYVITDKGSKALEEWLIEQLPRQYREAVAAIQPDKLKMAKLADVLLKSLDDILFKG